MMQYKGKREILITIAAFVLGICVMSLTSQSKQADTEPLMQQQYKLFDTEEMIISVSDHAFVEMQTCYENPSCNVQKSGDKITSMLKYRKQYEEDKKQL